MPSAGSCVSHSHSLSHTHTSLLSRTPSPVHPLPEAAALQGVPWSLPAGPPVYLGTWQMGTQGGCRSLWSSRSLWQVNSTRILLTTGGESDLEVNMSIDLWEG